MALKRDNSSADCLQNLLLERSALTCFKDVEREVLEDLDHRSILRSFTAKQILFLEKEPSAGLYVIQNGWIKVVKISCSGREQVLRYFGPGTVLNGVSAFSTKPNLVTAIALEPVDAWIIPGDSMHFLLERHPQLSRLAICILVNRIEHLVDMIEDLSLRTVRERLAHYLLMKADEEILWRQDWATQAEIASRLGTVPDVLNRILQDLEAEQLVRVDREYIEILNRNKLEEDLHLI